MAFRPRGGPRPMGQFTLNPFFVLQLPAGATPHEVTRAAAHLTAALRSGQPGASAYATPLGLATRTESLVCEAADALLDPDTRLQHEVWAEGGVGAARTDLSVGWESAQRAFGWRTR